MRRAANSACGPKADGARRPQQAVSGTVPVRGSVTSIMWPRLLALIVFGAGLLAACDTSRSSDGLPAVVPAPAEIDPPGSTLPPATTLPGDLPTTSPPTSAPTTTTTTTISPFARPEWMGTRILPLRDDEFGEVIPTPEEFAPRTLLTLDLLPPPTTDEYVATISAVPDDVLSRSTWHDECPVTVDELSYLTMTHWGFDGEVHTGEMIVNAAAAEDIVWVFEQLFDAKFPIEQMRVIDAFEIDLPPTGDWNDTTSFVCRSAVGSGSWSQHAYGLAIDINPFHNPYLKNDLVLPELASYYLDRDLGQSGMITEGGVAFQAFAEIGWPWGGNWNTLKDWMHFSQSGR